MPLHYALTSENFEAVHVLLEETKKRNIVAPNGDSVVCFKDRVGRTPLQEACEEDFEQLLQDKQW